MPENACGIAQVEDADSPRLHLRGLAHDSRVLPGEIQALDVLPPCVRVLDGQAHHEIARVLGNVEGLQQESEGAYLELCDLLVAPIDRKSEIRIELPGEFGVSGGYKGLEIGYGAWQHVVSLCRGGCVVRGQDMGG